MNVIALRHDDVFRYAGSYDSSPPSPSATLILARSVARIAPSTIGSEYSRPVRLSTIVRVSDGNAFPLVDSSYRWNLPVCAWFHARIGIFYDLAGRMRGRWSDVSATSPAAVGSQNDSSRQVTTTSTAAAYEAPPAANLRNASSPSLR